MTRALSSFVIALIALVVAALSVANRAPVRLTLDPFGTDPDLSVTMPLYAVIFLAVAAGVVAGGFGSAMVRRRRRSRLSGAPLPDLTATRLRPGPPR